MQSDTPYFSVYVDGTLAPFAFVDFNTDLATANAILEAIQKKVSISQSWLIWRLTDFVK